jgi:hypothetical protein
MDFGKTCSGSGEETVSVSAEETKKKETNTAQRFEWQKAITASCQTPAEASEECSTACHSQSFGKKASAHEHLLGEHGNAITPKARAFGMEYPLPPSPENSLYRNRSSVAASSTVPP